MTSGSRTSQRALAINEKVLGAEHPDTAASLNNLANVLGDQGDRAGAATLGEKYGIAANAKKRH